MLKPKCAIRVLRIFYNQISVYKKLSRELLLQLLLCAPISALHINDGVWQYLVNPVSC
jgi:hypothetical protein